MILSKELNLKSLARVKTLVILALMAALAVVLEKFLGINTPFFKMSFAYLPIAVSGMLYGIVPAILVSFVSDALSNLENFSFLFSILAILEGAVYGIFLHKKVTQKGQMLQQAIWSQLLVSLVIHAGLNTLLLWTLFGFFNPVRFLINALTFPIKVFTLYKMLGYRTAFEPYA